MSGNGDSKIEIDQFQLGDRWDFIEVGAMSPGVTDIGHYVNKRLVTWLQENPAIRVRSALPVIVGGEMVGVHVWWD